MENKEYIVIDEEYADHAEAEINKYAKQGYEVIQLSQAFDGHYRFITVIMRKKV